MHGMFLNGRLRINNGHTVPADTIDRSLGSPTFAIHQRVSLTSLYA